VEIIAGDPPACVALIEEWPNFALIGASVLGVLSRRDAAMKDWSSVPDEVRRAREGIQHAGRAAARVPERATPEAVLRKRSVRSARVMGNSAKGSTYKHLLVVPVGLRTIVFAQTTRQADVRWVAARNKRNKVGERCSG